MFNQNRLPEKDQESSVAASLSLQNHLFSCTARHRQAGHWHWYYGLRTCRALV